MTSICNMNVGYCQQDLVDLIHMLVSRKVCCIFQAFTQFRYYLREFDSQVCFGSSRLLLIPNFDRCLCWCSTTNTAGGFRTYFSMSLRPYCVHWMWWRLRKPVRKDGWADTVFEAMPFLLYIHVSISYTFQTYFCRVHPKCMPHRREV